MNIVSHRILNIVLLVNSCRGVSSQEGVISFDLEPTSFLYHKRLMNEDGRRRLESSENDLSGDNLPIISYHPFSNAVYSSVVELEGHGGDDSDRIGSKTSIYNDKVKEHNKLVHEFNSQRHISRYETLHIQDQTQHSLEEMIEKVGNNVTVAHDRRRLQGDTNLRGGLPPVLDSVNEQLTGGLYNDFQSAPLSQGYGTHYATVW